MARVVSLVAEAVGDLLSPPSATGRNSGKGMFGVLHGVKRSALAIVAADACGDVRGAG